MKYIVLLSTTIHKVGYRQMDQKIEIQRKINAYKKKIAVSKNKINTYQKDIKDLETAYNNSLKANNKYQDSLQAHFEKVLRSVHRLDRDSSFGNYYMQKVKSVLNGSDSNRVEEILHETKRRLLKSVQESEDKIQTERNNINYYKRKIIELENQLKTVG